jgi:hypothetical protein
MPARQSRESSKRDHDNRYDDDDDYDDDGDGSNGMLIGGEQQSVTPPQKQFHPSAFV